MRPSIGGEALMGTLRRRMSLAELHGISFQIDAALDVLAHALFIGRHGCDHARSLADRLLRFHLERRAARAEGNARR